jgi:hypothetical protein
LGRCHEWDVADHPPRIHNEDEAATALRGSRAARSLRKGGQILAREEEACALRQITHDCVAANSVAEALRHHVDRTIGGHLGADDHSCGRRTSCERSSCII